MIIQDVNRTWIPMGNNYERDLNDKKYRQLMIDN